MLDADNLPAAVDAESLAALACEHQGRVVSSYGLREAGGHLVKVYGLQAPGRVVTDGDLAAALYLADAHLRLGAVRGSLGLAVLIFHAGGAESAGTVEEQAERLPAIPYAAGA